METQSHFYFTLFSNASRDIYDEITHADFTEKLAQPVDLVSTYIWQVGLCKISCFSPPSRGNHGTNIQNSDITAIRV